MKQMMLCSLIFLALAANAQRTTMVLNGTWQFDRAHAGVLAFTHLTNNFGYTGDGYINNIKDLEPEPVQPWFKHAFAPSTVFINHPDERYMKRFAPHEPDAQLLFTIKAINDFSKTEMGAVTIKFYDAQSRVVWSQKQSIDIAPFGEMHCPVVMKLPKTPGGYTLVSAFKGTHTPAEVQRSKAYINILKSNHKMQA
ncbi:MAG: hypothetical protein HC819_00565 [Cyclobacteriaceae bacterium]|nr:hypothetical protein [Cyclobacteriaceae bacterium]